MGIGSEAPPLVPLQAGHADVENRREHSLREPVFLTQRNDLLGQHQPHLFLVRVVELMKTLIHDRRPSDRFTAFRANVMFDIGLDRHASDLLDMVPYLVCRVNFLPAFRAKQRFRARHVTMPFYTDTKEVVPPHGTKRRSISPFPE